MVSQTGGLEEPRSWLLASESNYFFRLRLGGEPAGNLLIPGFSGQDAGGDTDGDGVGRDVSDDDGVGADQDVVADADFAEEFGAGADVDAVTDDGGAGIVAVFEADGDAVAEDNVVTNDGIATDDDAAEVFNAAFVTTDIPEPKDLETMLEIGSWTWNWMEPPLGTLSFILLCMQYARAQVQNLGIKPYTELIKQWRGERLAKAFPKYDPRVLLAYSESAPIYRGQE